MALTRKYVVMHLTLFINPRPSRGHGVIVVCWSVCLSVYSESAHLAATALHCFAVILVQCMSHAPLKQACF